MFESVQSVKSQNIFRVQPVSMYDGSNGRSRENSEVNIFAGMNNRLECPSIENHKTLGKSLDLIA